MNKKQAQLGMNPSTASGKLVKDILFSFIKERPCHRCGLEMSRETFSVEHIVPWLDSDNPIELFFDINNISFSHIKCNVSAARRNKIHNTRGDAKQSQWARYYARNKEKVLKSKRDRYASNKAPTTLTII